MKLNHKYFFKENPLLCQTLYHQIKDFTYNIKFTMVYIYNKHPKVASCQHGHDYIRNPFHSKETCRDNLNN